MTTTVVGTALLSALIAGYRALSTNCPPHLRNSTPSSIAVEEMNSQSLLSGQTMDLNQHKRCTLDKLRSKADASARLCSCEGQNLIHERSFKKCNLCGHTACEKCAGKPKHDYLVLPKCQRLEPSLFIKWLIGRLPMRVQLVNSDISRMTKLYDDCKGHSTPESQNDWESYKGAVEQALGEVMCFESVDRLEHWVVRYDAPRSYLELFLGETPYWRIFIKPERQWPNNSRLRWLLKRPIARMRLISGDNILAGKWEFYLPVFLQYSLKIEGSGSMTDSWESHLGIQIQQPAVEKVHTKLEINVQRPVCRHIARMIDDVVGDYELLENCGTASRSLHKRIKPVEGSTMYFFLDPHYVGPKENDRFVFSRDHRRLSFEDFRDVVGSIDPEWRQGRAEAKGKANPMMAECRLYGLWEAYGATLQVFKSQSSLSYAVPGRDLSRRISPGMDLASNASNETRSCSADTITFISWKIPLGKPDNVLWPPDSWHQVDQQHEGRSLRSLSWFLRKARDIYQFSSEWSRLSILGEMTTCQSCSPDAPSVKWRQARSTDKRLIPYEDERQAGVFERALKARARPFITQTKLDECDSSFGISGCPSSSSAFKSSVRGSRDRGTIMAP